MQLTRDLFAIANFLLQVVKIAFAAARVVNMISTKNEMSGVTSVDDKLFLLLDGKDQIAVYSVNKFKRPTYLDLSGFKEDSFNDMTSCVRHKCLYMSDSHNRCIRRYDLASSAISKWSVPGKPHGLSVTPSGNLLVTCFKPNKLVELSADSGQCVRNMPMPSDIRCPWHGIELTTGEFVVCHGDMYSGIQGVCIVGGDGKVTHSYGGQTGSDGGQLNSPCHLAVDKDSQFIFVADRSNDRVVLLNSTLEIVRYFSEGLSSPFRLHLHQSARRLFVGQHSGRVTVIQL